VPVRSLLHAHGDRRCDSTSRAAARARAACRLAQEHQGLGRTWAGGGCGCAWPEGGGVGAEEEDGACSASACERLQCHAYQHVGRDGPPLERILLPAKP